MSLMIRGRSWIAIDSKSIAMTAPAYLSSESTLKLLKSYLSR